MKKGQKWTPEQIEYLKAHYRTERAYDIANVLNKSVSGVHHKACELKIGKDREGFFEVRSKAMSGPACGNFKNYRRKTKKGYIIRYSPEHPSSSKDGLIMEHRLIAEKHLGAIIPKEFVVHHINGDKCDNRIDNLAIMTNAAHTAFHNIMESKVPKGEKSPLYKKIDIQKAKELKAKGMKVNEICRELGIKRTKYFKEMRGA